MCARSTCTFCIVRLFSTFQSLSLATLVRRTEHLPSTSAAKTLHHYIHTSSNPRSRSRSLLHPLPLLSTLLFPGHLSIYVPRQTLFFHSLPNIIPPLYSIFVIILLPFLFPFTRFIILSLHIHYSSTRSVPFSLFSFFFSLLVPLLSPSPPLLFHLN